MSQSGKTAAARPGMTGATRRKDRKVTPAAAPARTALTGILLAVGGTICFSVNDMAVTFLSGGYALHQVILIRTLIAGTVLACVIAVSGTGLAQLRTRRWRAHLFRVCLIMVSNVTFFLGLAALPLAEGIALSFVAPLVITVMSVVFLGEQVGPRRWAAVAVGLVGVLVMLRPGAGVIQPAALLILFAACLYAGGHMMTRQMRDTESALALNYFVLVGFLVVCCLVGLVAGNGRFEADAPPILAFLFRPWVWPATADLPVFLALGLSIGVGGLMIAQAYRLCEAALVAPFEYVAMPMAIFWGLLVFGQWPDRTAWFGIALIVGAGLYALWRETVRQRTKDAGAGSGL